MARLGHQPLKGNPNAGTGHAEVAKKRGEWVNAAGLREVEGVYPVLVAAETQQVLGWFACTLTSFNVENAMRSRGWPVQGGTLTLAAVICERGVSAPNASLRCSNWRRSSARLRFRAFATR